MNDKEIRLEILTQFYKSARNNTKIPYQSDNEQLKLIPDNIYNFNYGYLVKKGLLKGSIDYSDDGTECATPTGGITSDGIDIVEDFVDRCVEEIKNSKNQMIDNSLSTIEKLTELALIWSKHTELYQHALEILNQILIQLNNIL